jgi:hypothetical protein
MSSRTTTTSTEKTIYILDAETNTLIPYKPDYNAGVPFTTAESISVAQAKKAPRAPKTDKQLGVIVPLIKQRPNQSDYVQLATIAQKYPRVNTIAIISPSNDERGVGDIGPDAEYVNAIRFLQNAGVQVVGYITTDESKYVDGFKREIDRWKQWYPDIDGLFFDNYYYESSTVEYAKVDKGFRLIIADATSKYNGGIVNSTDDFIRPHKAIDIFVIYEREGYPADGWYVNLKKDWMAQYPRSKFAFIPYRVPEDTFTCRNFIDKVVGIEKLAGYVYIHSAHETDRRKMGEWTNISSLLEVTLDQLDRMAQQEGIPSTKGVVPDTIRLDDDILNNDGFATRFFPRVGTTNQGEALNMRTDDSVTDTPPPEQGLAAQDMDKFGVRKIYPNSKDKASKEWYVFMDNPRADSRLKGLPDRLYKQADGSWQIQDEKGVVERALSVSPSKKGETFLNVEITGYFKVVQLPKKSLRDVIEMHVWRGPSQELAGYTAQLLKDGAVSFVKLMTPSITGNRGTTQATNNDLLNRWIGMKFIVYNSMEYDRKTKKDKEAVQMEIWIDDNVNDQDRNLVVKNDWKQIAKIQDTGGWFFKNKNKSKKKGVKKEDDKILTSPGNGVAWSWSNSATIINWKFLSVREIDIVRRD